ncbi:hypothetical protein J7T55_007159 [Diaporthe amygdali]|uniref:uncharacterized protein n=1 Tax=Phomopsis amygdali TaxID=1214568 RepID=UPI0022FF407F|nr:uncharacterized protein J7T55_007159 [Diaporthe amygdali]KAJ0108041.1 hypothetical protein J7T55_007159 [Diaporthe amygdali]
MAKPNDTIAIIIVILVIILAAIGACICGLVAVEALTVSMALGVSWAFTISGAMSISRAAKKSTFEHSIITRQIIQLIIRDLISLMSKIYKTSRHTVFVNESSDLLGSNPVI